MILRPVQGPVIADEVVQEDASVIVVQVVEGGGVVVVVEVEGGLAALPGAVEVRKLLSCSLAEHVAWKGCRQYPAVGSFFAMVIEKHP